MVEDWVKSARSEARVAFDARSEIEIRRNWPKKAREVVQLVKEAAEAEKQATYTLGVEKTQARLTEELTAVCRGYCNIS